MKSLPFISTIDISRVRTNVHYLVYHLTIADAITCFVTLPMETIWRATIEVSTNMVFIM